MLEEKLKPIVNFMGAVACVFFFVVVAMIAYEVIARYVFDAPTIWSHELSVLLCATAFLFGGPYVHQQRSHIVISVAADHLSPRWKRRAQVLLSLLALIFFLVLSIATFWQARDAITFMETSGTALNWPLPVILKSTFAFVAAFLALQSLLQLVADIRSLKQ
jgi:TRAP-type C4-dicarboxylate transport system permease small subunit